MALNIETSGSMRRPSDLVKLVEAVVAGTSEDEADWIEWKSTLAMTTAEGTYSLARQILGSAHRNPDSAARFMGGQGFIIVGAEPGSVEGVAPVDLAKLDSALEAYLGNPGPTWSGVYVEVQGKQVLVITVEAPRWGDPIYPLAKTFQGQARGMGGDAGAIFIRKQARTVPAGRGDVLMLQERLVRGQREEQALDLVVDVLPVALQLTPLDLTAPAIDVWIDHRREAVLAMRPPTREPRPGQTVFSAALWGAMERDPRSEEDYRREVESHLEKCRESLLAGVLHEASKRSLNVMTVRVSNPTPRNLPAVVLTLKIGGRVSAFEDDPESDWSLPRSATSTRVDDRQTGVLEVLVSGPALAPLDLVPYAVHRRPTASPT